MNEAASAGRPYQPATAAPVFRGRYLSITSYKRDGRGVATPVWFVQRDGRLLGRPTPPPARSSASAATRRSGWRSATRAAGCAASRCRPWRRSSPTPRSARSSGSSRTRPVRHDHLQAAPVRPGQAAPGTRADRAGDPGHHAQLTGSPAAGPGPRPRPPGGETAVRTIGLISDHPPDQIPASHRDLTQCPPVAALTPGDLGDGPGCIS